MAARALVIGVTMVLAACTSAVDPGKIEGPGRIGWQFADASVPKGLQPPIVDGGIVLNSYRDADRVVVTIVYGSSDRSRLQTVYDEWSAARGGVKSGRGFDVQGRVAWQDSWEAGVSEVRLSECLNELSGEFDNLCVALTTWVGSVP